MGVKQDWRKTKTAWEGKKPLTVELDENRSLAENSGTGAWRDGSVL